MRNLTLITLLSTVSLMNCQPQSQTTPEKTIQQIIGLAEEAAANRNINLLSQLLHEDYRVVANRFKGSKSATIISKDVYLSMMESEKIGGTSYTIKFNDVKITAHTAMVDLLFISEESSDMHKYLILIQDEKDQWKIVSDIPIVME
ncbi:hypothetical protein [Roseivirga sp.]|uniref:hypothetical protein n=1 Tax=Roseivirga sp. TaxID=1964215 RepID=UPI003B521376